jgi:hypothetical protein
MVSSGDQTFVAYHKKETKINQHLQLLMFRICLGWNRMYSTSVEQRQVRELSADFWNSAIPYFDRWIRTGGFQVSWRPLGGVEGGAEV